jgi:hypothetical protein
MNQPPAWEHAAMRRRSRAGLVIVSVSNVDIMPPTAVRASSFESSQQRSPDSGSDGLS